MKFQYNIFILNIFFWENNSLIYYVIWIIQAIHRTINFSFTITIIITIIIIQSLEFFKSVLTDGISLEFEWQQVSSSLPDSSQYSGRSQ